MLLHTDQRLVVLLKGLVTNKGKSLDTDLGLIAKKKKCLFNLLLCAPVISYGHVKILTVESDVKQ